MRFPEMAIHVSVVFWFCVCVCVVCVLQDPYLRLTPNYILKPPVTSVEAI